MGDFKPEDRWRVMIGDIPGSAFPGHPALVAPGDAFACANGDGERLRQLVDAYEAALSEREALLAEVEELRAAVAEDDDAQAYLDRVDDADRARARAEKAERERGWQPIATAPKDGGRIAVYSPDLSIGYRISEAAWLRHAWRHEKGFKLYPSHWMPLPSVYQEAPDA